MKRFLPLIILVSFLLLAASGIVCRDQASATVLRVSAAPRPIPDTIPKPRYEYYYKLMIPINRFNQPLDTIDMVMQRMGKSMTVDQADELRGIVVKQLRDFIGRPVMDSVKVGGKP